jgi:hypothetical protein
VTIPSSTMGAASALEYALSLPECLRLAGKENAHIGTKVHEFLRYDTPMLPPSVYRPMLTVINFDRLQRVTILQRAGFANRREIHNKDGMEGAVRDAIDNDPLRLGKWDLDSPHRGLCDGKIC